MMPPLFRRLVRRMRFATRRCGVWFVHHPRYGVAPVSQVDPRRAEKILAFLAEAGLIGRRDISTALPASLENVLRVHSAAYVESLADPQVLHSVLGIDAGPRDVEMALEVVRLHVGGTIQATRLARRTGGVAVNLGGGFHRATPDRGMGFSVLNDVAIAIARLRVRHFTQPILVVDLDLHDGNGTRAAFAEDETVHTFSIHNETLGSPDAKATTTLALGSGVTDVVFMDAVRRELPPIARALRPGLIVYVAGVDGAAGDAVGDWRLTADGLLERDRFVTSLARSGDSAVPLVIVLAGGYGPSAWRYSARFFSWLIAGAVVEPPDDADMVLRQFHRIAATLTDIQAPAPDSGRELTAEDLSGVTPDADTRFLGHFSRHALELHLEQSGVLDDMRARGFRNLSVTLDVSSDTSHSVRIYGDPARQMLLMELRAGRTRRVLPDMELIEVEWLRMQDPRSDLPRTRALLPGQLHPGLGMLRTVAAWLVVVCERLNLDGVAFVPSQFYMAGVGREHLRFVEPEMQARFEAMAVALATVELGEANAMVDGGGVIDATTGEPAVWIPSLMVLPVSQRLRGRVMGDEYRQAVERAMPGFSFGLAAP